MCFIYLSTIFTVKSNQAKIHWNKLTAGYWYNSMYYPISYISATNGKWMLALDIIILKIILKNAFYFNKLLLQNNKISASDVNKLY